MSVIAIQLAMDHLRAEDDDLELVQAYLDAAEEAAVAFLQRRFYADAAAMALAQADVDERRRALVAKYEERLRTSSGSMYMPSPGLVDQHRRRLVDLEDQFLEELAQLAAIEHGLVINAAIQTACLLTLGHLYNNREDSIIGVSVVALPLGSRTFLAPYRRGLGV